MRDVTIVYGMTETSPVSFQSAVDDPVDKRVTTVGRVQPHLEVKIIDAEGNVTPRGTAGELLTLTSADGKPPPLRSAFCQRM